MGVSHEISRYKAAFSALALSAMALGGCDIPPSEFAPHNSPSPSVEARVTKPADVLLSNGNKVSLAVGTMVLAECDNTRVMQSENTTLFRSQIETGPYKGEVAENVPVDDIQNTTDPFGAAKQTPPQ